MAQKVMVSLVDDLDGSEAEETVHFALDGVTYELDLSEDNAASLREVLAPYVAVARRDGRPSAASRSRRGRERSSSAAPGAPSASEIREWGRQNGWTVSERGRVPAELTNAYHEAH